LPRPLSLHGSRRLTIGRVCRYTGLVWRFCPSRVSPGPSQGIRPAQFSIARLPDFLGVLLRAPEELCTRSSALVASNTGSLPAMW
jgi:hypothetical protein